MNAQTSFGGRIVAFFDLDGTLIPEPTLEKRFFAALRRNGEIPLVNYLRWSTEALRLLPQGLSNVRYANKRYLTGICRELTTKYLESIAFFEEGVGRIEWHARRGHEIVLLTGTLEPLACLAATALECELEARGVSTRLRICATQLEEDGGRWTGRVIGDALFGRAKAHALQKVAEEEGVDLHECHGYGNSLTDRDFLSAVSHPNAVNASREMAAVANQNDWAIWHWHLEKRVDVRPEAEIEPGENESLSAGIQEAGERA